VRNGDILILKGQEIASLLSGRETELLKVVQSAYLARAGGDSSLPHSTFLRFPHEQRNRIIALPAYLGDEFAVAGIKWVSSFPGNLEKDLERASAVLILNSIETGRPEAILEGSIISAKRTAASAALAAQVLQSGERARVAGLVGCGLINFEIARFLLTSCPDIQRFLIQDIDADRAEQFKNQCRSAFVNIEVETAEEIEQVFEKCKLVSLATTASAPHIPDLSRCAPGSTILHVSLRDLSPEVILSCDNVVDEVDHVCRAQTSVHLAEQLVGHRDFIRCTLADVLGRKVSARRDDESITIFSPFGLGVLDIAVGKLVCGLALDEQQGTVIESFMPENWTARESFARA
jgi:ornithine cyclodeaminase